MGRNDRNPTFVGHTHFTKNMSQRHRWYLFERWMPKLRTPEGRLFCRCPTLHAMRTLPSAFSLCIKKRFNAKGFSCLGCFLRQCLAVRAERQEAVGKNWGGWTEISSFFFRRITSYKKAENNNRVSEECWDVPSVIVSNLKHWCQFGRSVRSIV